MVTAMFCISSFVLLRERVKLSTDHYVGGPIDAVELDKGGTIRWIQRKSNCKD